MGRDKPYTGDQGSISKADVLTRVTISAVWQTGTTTHKHTNAFIKTAWLSTINLIRASR